MEARRNSDRHHVIDFGAKPWPSQYSATLCPLRAHRSMCSFHSSAFSMPPSCAHDGDAFKNGVHAGDTEHLYRENRKLERLLKDARLRIQGASFEDIRASTASGLSKENLAAFRSERWISEHLNMLLCGATGVGKTHLACALGQFACRRGHRTTYKRLPRLLEELTVSRADGSCARLPSKLEKSAVLIIDDWGLTPLKDSHRRDILEILEDRHGKASTVITSQLPLSKWHGYIGEPTIADAILDRLVHSAYKCELKGDSRRKTKTQG